MLKLTSNFLLLFMALSVAIDARAQSAPTGGADNGRLIAQSAYAFPESHEQWLQAIDKDAAVGTSARYRQLYSKEMFEACRFGAAASIQRIVYLSDGLRINGYMVKPVGASAPAPVIIFNHGGVMQWGDVRFNEILEMCRLAKRGYLLLASHFRGEGGSEGKPEMGGGDVTDTLHLIALAERLPEADAKRIGMWGFSRGGGVTYQALAATNRLAAAVIIGGPADSINSHRREEFDEHVYPHVLQDYEKDKEAALTRISPIRWVEKLAANTPLLLLHGGGDWRVLTTDSLRMALRLQELERPYRLKIYEGGSHNLLENYAEVRSEMDRWFDLYLRDRVAPPANKAVAPLGQK